MVRNTSNEAYCCVSCRQRSIYIILLRVQCWRFTRESPLPDAQSPRLKIAALNPCLSEHLCYNSFNPNQLSTAMPNIRNFSNPEKPRAMDRLNIHDDFNAARLLTGIIPPTHPRWRKNLPRGQNATLSEKGFPMSDKRTMSDILLTHTNNPIPSRLLPTPPAKTPIMPINDRNGECH